MLPFARSTVSATGLPPVGERRPCARAPAAVDVARHLRGREEPRRVPRGPDIGVDEVRRVDGDGGPRLDAVAGGVRPEERDGSRGDGDGRADAERPREP